MDKSSRILLALIFALLSYWFLTRSNEESEKQEIVSVEPADSAPLKLQSEPMRPVVPPPTKQTQSYTQAKTPMPQSEPVSIQAVSAKPTLPPFKMGMMRWKNINGWAVTHGDILLGKLQEPTRAKFGSFKPRPNRLWPSSTIPYVIAKDVPNSQAILDAIQIMNENTVIKFVPYKGQQDALIFVKFDGGHCASYLGKVLPQQPIMLSEKCGVKEILHEILHALGFVHEQSRPDRDKYVEIIYENIQDEFVNQFDVISDEYIHEFTGSVFFFDYESIMLYPPNAFAKEASEPTMTSRTSTPIPSQKTRLSTTDIERLYYLYGGE